MWTDTIKHKVCVGTTGSTAKDDGLLMPGPHLFLQKYLHSCYRKIFGKSISRTWEHEWLYILCFLKYYYPETLKLTWVSPNHLGYSPSAAPMHQHDTFIYLVLVSRNRNKNLHVILRIHHHILVLVSKVLEHRFTVAKTLFIDYSSVKWKILT